MKKGIKPITTFIISIILALISMIGANLVQTNGGKIKYKDVRVETPSGNLLSALLLIPPNATKDNKAPAIITSHGWYNNREMQDLNYVEYARRGYVVMAIDMYGHGNSDPVKPSEWQANGTGMYDAVNFVANLPYVNKEQIGVTGHSNGARAANWSVKIDNERTDPLISAVFLVANEPMYSTNPQEPIYWANMPENIEYRNNYGKRDVGVLAGTWDEFFFRSKLPGGGHTYPKDYIDTPNAQSFLNFGENPDIVYPRRSNVFFDKIIDGKIANRIIYTPMEIHPLNHFSMQSAGAGIQFFQKTLPAPKPLPPTNQIWPLKAFFNAIGLVAFVMFLVSLTLLLLSTKAFESLKAGDEVKIGDDPEGNGILWFWGILFVGAIYSGISYYYFYPLAMKIVIPYFPQQATLFIGLWSASCGIFTLILMLINYFFNLRYELFNLKDTGLYIGFKNFLKTIILAVTVCFFSFGLVFLADYFFKTDFRLWVIAIKAFQPDKIAIAGIYLPFFLIYFVMNSIAINCFSYVKLLQKEWVNTFVMALFNMFGLLVIVVIQYYTFIKTGETFFTTYSNILEIWLFPMLVILPVAALISRKLYKATRNPYLGAFINAIAIALIICSNTLTQIN